LYRDRDFEAFDDFSDFLESISCESSESCQVRGSNPCWDRPGPPECRPGGRPSYCLRSMLSAIGISYFGYEGNPPNCPPIFHVASMNSAGLRLALARIDLRYAYQRSTMGAILRRKQARFSWAQSVRFGFCLNLRSSENVWPMRCSCAALSSVIAVSVFALK
jgi:hypothetical protein